MFGFDDDNIEVRYILAPYLPPANELIGTLLCVQVRHHVSMIYVVPGGAMRVGDSPVTLRLFQPAVTNPT